MAELMLTPAFMPVGYTDLPLGEVCYDKEFESLREGITLNAGTPAFGEAGQKLSQVFIEVMTHLLERTHTAFDRHELDGSDYTPIPPRQGPKVRVLFKPPSRGIPASYEFEDF